MGGGAFFRLIHYATFVHINFPSQEARETNTNIFWNVWVLLAMPSVFLAFSTMLFIAAILSFVWRSGSVDDPDPRPLLSAKAALGPRIAVSIMLGLGMMYFVLIVKTLRRYGGKRNREWLWRTWSASNNGGNVGAREGDRSGDGDTGRGRQRERVPRDGTSQRERESAREGTKEQERNDQIDRQRNDSEKGESGEEKAPSGLRRVLDLRILGDNPTIEVVPAGSSDDIVLEKQGVSEKVTGSDGSQV
jgi:hypothetical protein